MLGNVETESKSWMVPCLSREEGESDFLSAVWQQALQWPLRPSHRLRTREDTEAQVLCGELVLLFKFILHVPMYMGIYVYVFVMMHTCVYVCV